VLGERKKGYAASKSRILRKTNGGGRKRERDIDKVDLTLEIAK